MGFKPYGAGSAGKVKEPVMFLYEEYEALRLCDYDMFNHQQAAEAMAVSRPTFTRIYSSARRKLATSFVEGRKIILEGGKVYYDSDWHKCDKCSCFFNNPDMETSPENCPLCGSDMIKNFNPDDLPGSN